MEFQYKLWKSKRSILNFQAITSEVKCCLLPAVLVFWGEKSQTQFSSFMFHIQATSQQTLVFTLMLIKVNYFVVLVHWYKTCTLFSLRYKQKFKISRCFQHKLMTNLCFPIWFKAFFQSMFELPLLFYAKCSHDSFGILFPLFFYFFTFMMLELFFQLEPSPELQSTQGGSQIHKKLHYLENSHLKP